MLQAFRRKKYKHRKDMNSMFTSLLSGLQLTAYMVPLWPSSEDSCPIFSPVLPSYIIPFLSELTLMNLLPSGENLTQLTKFEWSLQIQKMIFQEYSITSPFCIVATLLLIYTTLQKSLPTQHTCSNSVSSIIFSLTFPYF